MLCNSLKYLSNSKEPRVRHANPCCRFTIIVNFVFLDHTSDSIDLLVWRTEIFRWERSNTCTMNGQILYDALQIEPLLMCNMRFLCGKEESGYSRAFFLTRHRQSGSTSVVLAQFIEHTYKFRLLICSRIRFFCTKFPNRRHFSNTFFF